MRAGSPATPSVSTAAPSCEAATMTPDTLQLYHSPLMTESRVAAVPTTDAKSKPRMFLGLTMGLLAAAIGALYSVYATYGLARGLKPADMTFLRTGVAGLLT